MKKLFNLFASFLLTFCLYGQAPEKLSFQSVIRDPSGQLIVNKLIGIQISILKGDVNGNAVYSETHTATSNSNGLLSLQIGDGVIVFGNFLSINWSNGEYFIKTEIDTNGGSNYNIVGTSKLLSVPFALESKHAATSNEVDPVFMSSASKDITSANISDWNSVYSWGNHALQGYLKS